MSLSVLDDLGRVVDGARRLSSEMGTLPSTVRDALNDIRNRLLEIAQHIELDIRAIGERIDSTVQRVYDRVSTIIDNLLERFEPLLSALGNSLGSLGGNIGVQIGDLLNSVSSSIGSLQELIPLIKATPKIVKNIPAYIVSGTIILLVVIALGILIYKFIMEGTARLGINPLIVFACLIFLLIAILIMAYMYLRMKMREVQL